MSIIFQFLMSAGVIVVAGSFLTRFADKIGEETGLGRILAGSILLASATSLPELMVDINALRIDTPDLAVGDLFGSSLFNLLILATLDFSFPSSFRRTAFSSDFLHHSLAAVLSILLTAIAGLGILVHLNVEVFGIGPFTWALLVTYLFGLRLIFFDRKIDTSIQDAAPSTPLLQLIQRKSLQRALLGYITSSTFILLAAPYLIEAADQIAKISGLGHTFIGTTLVALSTSLPELVATLAAIRMGAPDLALGNIFGSNTFNMVLLIPLDLIYSKPILSSVRTVHAITAFCVVAVTSVAVLGHLYRKKDRLRFAEPSSEVIVALIVLSLYLIFRFAN